MKAATRKFILKMIDREQSDIDGFIVSAQQRIDSGRYPVIPNQEHIDKLNKRLKALKELRDDFVKTA